MNFPNFFGHGLGGVLPDPGAGANLGGEGAFSEFPNFLIFISTNWIIDYDKKFKKYFKIKQI